MKARLAGMHLVLTIATVPKD